MVDDVGGGWHENDLLVADWRIIAWIACVGGLVHLNLSYLSSHRIALILRDELRAREGHWGHCGWDGNFCHWMHLPRGPRHRCGHHSRLNSLLLHDSYLILRIAEVGHLRHALDDICELVVGKRQFVQCAEDLHERLHEIREDADLDIIVTFVVLAGVILGELKDGIILQPVHQRFQALLRVSICVLPIGLVNGDDTIVGSVGVEAPKVVEES